MQYMSASGSLIVKPTGSANTPVGITVQDDYDVYSNEILLTGDQAKQLAEQLLGIWGDDLDNDLPG